MYKQAGRWRQDGGGGRGGSAECVKVSALINKPALCLGCDSKNMRAASAKNYIYTRPRAFNKGVSALLHRPPSFPSARLSFTCAPVRMCST